MAFDKLTGISAITIVIAAAAMIALCVVFIVFRVRESDLTSYDLTTRPMRLGDLSAAAEVKGDRIPPTVRGSDFSYSFWLYIANFDPLAADDKARAVFFRGDQAAATPAAQTPFSPIVALDNDANRLKVLIKTTASRADLDVEQIIADPRAAGWVVATVEYMPLQRWVNIVVTVKGTKVVVYLDGDMYTMESSSFLNDAPAAAAAGISNLAGVLPSETSGSVFVGNMSPDAKSIDGTLTKLQFFNYALERDDVRTLYLEGPQKRTLMASLGLSSYGLQAPIYKS